MIECFVILTSVNSLSRLTFSEIVDSRYNKDLNNTLKKHSIDHRMLIHDERERDEKILQLFKIRVFKIETQKKKVLSKKTIKTCFRHLI